MVTTSFTRFNCPALERALQTAQEWLWCETWCGNATLGTAKTIDLCNNPLTKEPKLAGARRIVAEWPALDAEVIAFTAQVPTCAFAALLNHSVPFHSMPLRGWQARFIFSHALCALKFEGMEKEYAQKCVEKSGACISISCSF